MSLNKYVLPFEVNLGKKLDVYCPEPILQLLILQKFYFMFWDVAVDTSVCVIYFFNLMNVLYGKLNS